VVISDANGCSDSTTTTVTVNPNPTVSILPNPAEVCAGDVLAMDGNPAGGGGTYTTHDWTGAGAGSLDATNVQTPNFSNATGGSYNLIYTVTDNNGCVGTATIDVTVFDTPVIDPIADTAVCADFTFPAITGTNVTANASYWTGMGGTGTEYLVGSTYNTAGTVTLYAYDGANGCSSEVPFNLTVNELPTVVSVSGGGTYCQGDAINNILVDVTGQASWTVNYTLDGTPQQATGAASPVDLGNAPGVYVITSVDDAVCSNTASGSETIVVNPIPAAPTAGTDGEFCSTVSLDPLTASGSGGSFTWYDDATLTGVLATTDTYQPTNTLGTTSYFVTETLNGCEGPASEVIISVITCDIVIPTAFTPNNDNAHDVWVIENITNAYPNHVVRIYNRWGTQLFESPEGGYEGQEWDGSYNGQLLPVGSYYYIIEFNDDEGGSAQGTVSIIHND
jgi:gliding motility-associated-like protein